MDPLNNQSEVHPFFRQQKPEENDEQAPLQQGAAVPSNMNEGDVHPFFSQTRESTTLDLVDEEKRGSDVERIITNNPKDTFADAIETEEGLDPTPEEDVGFLSSAASDVGEFVTSGDIIFRPAEGAAKAVGEMVQTIESAGEYLQDITGIGGLQFVDPETGEYTFRYLSAKEWRDQGLKDSLIRLSEEVAEAAQEAIPDAETTTGAIVEGISQFATGFVLARRATGFTGIGGTLANSAIADATAFDPYEQNISAMLQENAWMRNSFTEALATDENSSEFTNRLRNAGEGLIVGGTLELAAGMYKAARATRKAKEEFVTTGSVTDDTAKEFDTATDELEAMTEKLQKEADEFLSSSVPSEEVTQRARQEYTKKYDIEAAKANTAAEAAEQKELSSKVAARNQDIARELIESFELRLASDPEMTVTKVSREVDGKLEIDPELARAASKEKMSKLVNVKERKAQDIIFGTRELEVDEAINLSMSEGDMFSAVLKPEKFDAVVSIAAEYRGRFGDEWDAAGDTVIDKLFNLTVDKKLVGGEDLLTDLAKYGLSFEDYIMTVVGSGSEAGRTLQKLSAIKRQRPLTSQEELKQKELLEQQDTIRKTFMRIENIRRGLMVSQVATAARNLQSTLVRAPMETLGNVMDDSLVAFAEGGFGGFARTFSSRDTWKRSFQHMDLMFRNRKTAEEYSQLFLKQPELIDRFDNFYNAMADMQLKMGRGQATTNAGKVVDATLSMAEDATAFLNTANRWQEFMTRNSVFLADMERLIARDWGIDLIDQVNKGKIRDIMGDASTVKPAGARSFIDIADEAIYNAMDVTYAAAPQLRVFNDLNNFIVRNGLTTVLPFPRFMFKSMELLGKYGAGASIPMTRMAMRFAKKGLGRQVTEIVDGKEVTRAMTGTDVRSLTRAERDMVGKNMQGLALVGAAIWYRSQEDVPEEYYLMNADEGFTLDTSAIFPLRPLLLIGEIVQQVKQGTEKMFFENNPKEIAEVLTGQNFRAGPANFILEDIVSTVFGDSEVSEGSVKRAGAALGNYFSTFLVPYGQIIDSARSLGLANNEYKDQANEPSLDRSTTFYDNFERPFRSRYDTGPERPNREMVLQEDMDRKRMGAKVLLGLNFKAADPEYADYLKGKGYTEFMLGSNSKSPEQRREENVYIREYLKAVAPVLKEMEDEFRTEWNYMDDFQKDGLTFDQAFSARYLNEFEKDLRDTKRMLRESTGAELTDEVRAYLAYNKLPRKIKRNARVEYQINMGEKPDMTDPQTVLAVTEIGQEIRRN